MPDFDRFQTEIEPKIAATLLERLEEIRTIDEAILRERTRGSILVRSCSAGKPWFSYDELMQPCELLRVRAVEKWLHHSPVKHGAVLVFMQSVFARQEQRQEQAVMTEGEKRTFILEAFSDEKVSAQYRIRFRGNGSVYGALLTRTDAYSPLSVDSGSDVNSEMSDFYWQQPDLESEYRRSSVTSDDVARLNRELTDFIDEEHALASYRALLRM